MKTKIFTKRLQRYSAWFFAAFTASAFFYSCQKEPISKPISSASMTDNAMLKSIDCESDCIQPGGPYFEASNSRYITYGQNNKTVSIAYYNTESSFIIKVKSTKGWNDLVLNGADAWPGSPVAANVWDSISLPLAQGWQACDLMKFTLAVEGQGPPVTFINESYSLVGMCPQGCESSFSGEAISCGSDREAVYRLRASEDMDNVKIQGGLTNFTGADAEISITGGNLVASQSSPGGSSNRVIKLTGSVSACEEVVIRIRWNSTNSGGIITGSWSAKNGGVEIAPNVEGLFCQ